MTVRPAIRNLVATAAAALVFVGVVRRAGATCHSYQCGGNTPILWGTFIRGLSTQSQPNIEGVVLRPKLIPDPSGPCPGEMSLSSEDGVLRGVGSGGVTVCEGRDLIGASFDLDVPYKALTMRTRLRFTAVDEVSSWEIEGATVVPTYRFDVVATGAIPAPGGPPPDGARPFGPVTPTPVCQDSAPWMEDWQQDGLQQVLINPAVVNYRYDNPEGTVGQQWQVGTNHALIVSGETYTEDGSSAANGPQWFQIACAGSAIAKMRLLGIDPWDPRTVEAGLSVATLKMLGARYGGTSAFTRPGTPLRWERWDRRAFYGGPRRGLTIGPLEGTWTAKGADCVSHLRLMRASFGIRWLDWFELAIQVRLQREFRLHPCPGSAHAVWTTTTVDHIMH